jgi:hypothetical protein
VIDPNTQMVIGTFLVSNCSPAGLALGPNNEALLGCGSAFGTPPTTQSLIIDITSTNFTLNGAVVATVPIGGSDEVWYDPGTQHYFLAARANLAAGSPAPILGSIDAVSHQLDSSIPSSTTSHSVAADQNSHLVFLPAGFVPPTSTTPDPNNPCPTTGCIAVYFSPFFAGTPGQANCQGKSVSALARKFGDLTAAAAALGFPRRAGPSEFHYDVLRRLAPSPPKSWSAPPGAHSRRAKIMPHPPAHSQSRGRGE